MAGKGGRRSKNGDTRVPLKRIVLVTAGTAGLISMAVLAPNALSVVRQLSGHRRHSLAHVTSTMGRLESRGFITYVTKRGKTYIRLTEKGKAELCRYQMREKTLRRRRWDRKWRIIAFDVREYKKGTRERIRHELVSFGFVRLQNSVWVFPYPCEEVMKMLKAYFKIGKEVLYIEATYVEHDAWLRRHFGL